MDRYIDEVASNVDATHPHLALAMRKLAPFVLLPFRILLPLVRLAADMLGEAWRLIPISLVQLCFGLVLTFFGGSYITSLAALEAARRLGGQSALEDVRAILRQAASERSGRAQDDAADRTRRRGPEGELAVISAVDLEEGDVRKRQAGGVGQRDATPTAAADVSPLAEAMRRVSDPDRLDSAMVNLVASLAAVLATLSFNLAQLAALGLGVAELLLFPATRLLTPLVAALLAPPRLKHWIRTVINAMITWLCIAAAWFAQPYLAPAYSALRGGRLAADALFALLPASCGCMGHLPNAIGDDDAVDDSFIDEWLAYAFAAVGLLVQLVMHPPILYPVSLVLAPLTALEWLLRCPFA